MPADLPTHTDLAIIGAGPAGLAAAETAARHGASVVVLDEQPKAGGQIYRNVGAASPARIAVLGAEYGAGAALLAALDAEGVTHVPDAAVWEVTTEREIYFSVAGRAHALSARRIIIATGATERPMPFPGWTLPGVMTAGAGQILLKSAGLLPATPVVLAGSGPLVYLMAVQLLAAGVAPAAIVDTTPSGNRRTALGHLFPALSGHRLLRKGLGLLWRIRQAGIPHHRHATELRAEGSGRVAHLSFRTPAGRRTIPCATLLLHTGVVPNVQISRSLGLEHRWDAGQMCWRPVLDATGQSGIEGVWIAGDGAGISGAEAAVPAGRIAALAAIAGLEGTTAPRPGELSSWQAQLRKLNAVRPFLEALYAPAPEFLSPADETCICRCEEVTAGQIRDFVKLGCLGPNQAKSYGRCGMGPCQGRYCGLTVSHVIAEARGVPVEEVGYYRLRPPLKPVTLGELASMAHETAPAHAG